MRIISGKKRGLKLETLAGENTRPTLDRVREALFSILGGNCDGLEVLDLFAGSGALGLEAVSRGAKHATFIEKSNEAFAVLNTNIKKLNMPECTTSLKQDAMVFLKCGKKKYDLIFLDPPYKNTILNDILIELINHCEKNATLVIETDGTYPLIIPPCYKIKSTRQYGRVQLTIIQNEE